MASAFKTVTSVNVGTSLASVYTCPSNTTSTVIGCYVCNQSGGMIEATVEFFDSSASHHATIIKSSPIPSGTSVVVIGGDGKVVLEAGDIIKVQSNVASSIDVTLSYLEQT
jgi:hypothetical protein